MDGSLQQRTQRVTSVTTANLLSRALIMESSKICMQQRGQCSKSNLLPYQPWACVKGSSSGCDTPDTDSEDALRCRPCRRFLPRSSPGSCSANACGREKPWELATCSRCKLARVWAGLNAECAPTPVWGRGRGSVLAQPPWVAAARRPAPPALVCGLLLRRCTVPSSSACTTMTCAPAAPPRPPNVANDDSGRPVVAARTTVGAPPCDVRGRPRLRPRAAVLPSTSSD